MTVQWEPIGHCPPLPRIDMTPRYTPAPANDNEVPDHIRQQIEHMHEIMRAKQAAQIWQTIVDAARTA